jgi:hypothetical protein
MVEPTKRRSKGKAITSVKTWDDFSSEHDLQRRAATDPHHTHPGHHASASWQEVKRVFHPLVMIAVMMMTKVRKSPP